MVQQIIFCILALIMIVCSVLAVTSQRIIRSAVYLLFVLLCTAGLYLMLDYHYLMAVQMAVYAGGIMVLFIFAILLTQSPGVRIKREKPVRMLIAGGAALIGLAICGHLIYHNVTKVYNYIAQPEMDMRDIGLTMMGTSKYQYMLPFEAMGVLLLGCIIAALLIARINNKEGQE